jgi:cholesterol transport system auxiliary component
MRKRFFLAMLGLALAGCVNLGGKNDTPATAFYVLSDTAKKDADPPGAQARVESPVGAAAPALLPADADPLPAEARVESYAPQGDSDPLRAKARVESYAPTLLVLDTTTGGFYDTDQIVFSRSAGTRGHYQFARWTERPGKRFATLMRNRLERMGTYRVAAAGGYVRGDLLLDSELVEFYHDAVHQPGQVRLVLRAELVDLRERSLLGRRVFEQQVPLTTYDAAGTAQASNEAISRVLDDLTAWLATLQ